MAKIKIVGAPPAPPPALLEVKAVPKAAATRVDFSKEPVEVRVTAPPDKGKANAAIVAALADALGIAKSRLTIVSGETARRKKLRIDAG